MRKIKNLLLITAASFALLISFSSSSVYADSPQGRGTGSTSGDSSSSGNAAADAIQQGACDAAGDQACDSGTATSSLNKTIANIINLLSVVAGIIAVIMIILAGLRYVTSAGSTEGVASAKRSLLYAIVGLVVVALAQIIVRFVLTRVTATQ